jgi:chromate transporter
MSSTPQPLCYEPIAAPLTLFRAGSLVFGGGHVVLPLLQSEVVQNGWVSNDLFMAGYGAAQAIPGPLFSFSAYLGAVASVAPSTWSGAVLCLIAAFLPGYFLIVGTLPFWESFRKMSQVRFAMQGINAVVVGLLLAAFYNPVWTNAIFNSKDFCLAVLCFLFIVFWKTPSWFVVIFCAVVSRAIF